VALSENQKKYIVLGTVGGAFALFVGSLMFGDKKASAAPMLGPPGARSASPGMQAPPGRHDKHRTKRRHDDEGDGRERERDNDRGEYGRKKKHHHKGHRHGH
jgi:hypothetical protein